MRLIFIYIKFFIDYFIHSTIMGKSYYELQVIRFNKKYEGMYLLWCDQESKEYFITDHTNCINRIRIIKLIKDNKEVESKVFLFSVGEVVVNDPKAIELLNKSNLIMTIPSSKELCSDKQIIKDINKQELRILVRMLMAKVTINYKYIILANTLRDRKVITYNRYQSTI